MYIDPDMPDEFQAGQARPHEIDDEALSALGVLISGLRSDAVKAREASGIEEVWRKAEDAYLGIDDANRHEFNNAKWAKPSSMEGPLTRASAPNSTRSTAFVRLTSRYVDMGSAKLSEMILPIDDKAFSFGATPIPELVKETEDKSPYLRDGQPMWRPVNKGENPAQPPVNGMVPAKMGDVAKAAMDYASDCAKKAETRIYDWMVESKYPLEMRKTMHDSARLGCGVIKGPFPKVTTNWIRSEGQVVSKTKLSPGMRSISPWNLYPDGSCGENVHDGDYIFEVDKLAASKVKALKQEFIKGPGGNVPVYIQSQLDKVLEEGPGKCFIEAGSKESRKTKSQYQIWYFTGVLSRKQMETLGAIGLEDFPDSVTDVDCIVTMINDSVVRATVNPLKSGNFPYRVHNWSRREGSWAGVGVAEQVSMPQITVNAGTRALFNNAGITAGGQIVVDRSQIEPADGSWAIVPNKVWWTRADATGTDDIRKVFMSFEFPNMGQQLQAVIDYGFRLAEEASNIPLVVQGRETSVAQTFGEAEQQNTNAHTLLRYIAYTVDDCITDPLVHDLYQWLLLDEDVPDDEKGDFEINAKGSIAMVERAIQEQLLVQMLPMSKDPAFGWNPKKLAARFLKAKRIDGRDVEYTEDELAEMAQRPPPEDPRIVAAKISADTSLKVAAGHDQATVNKMKMDTDRDRAYVMAETERTTAINNAAERKLEMQLQLAQLDYANKRQISLDEVKAELAQTAMKLQTQVQLAGVDGKGPQITTPPTEPAGRAENGEAYQS